MTFTKIPVKGTKDILIKEMRIREDLINTIKSVYKSFGYEYIDTPILEHIDNLTSNQGGDNEKLIFKILKRGNKFNFEDISNHQDICDIGLRYDLTLPLSRFYSNNIDILPNPFKAIQIGNVFRADRPQKGRFRQFTQCDIDILGEDSNLAEIDLICATAKALSSILDDTFEIRINDRRIIESIIESVNINKEDASLIMIELDKIDRIGLDGFVESIENKGIESSKVESFSNIFSNCLKCKSVDDLKDILDNIDISILDDLTFIIDTVKNCKIKGLDIVFDPTIIRGMNYYTGPIFEIKTAKSNLSVGGGGRYDNMVSNFLNAKVPACGFSIGFERIVGILLESDCTKKTEEKKEAILIDKKTDKAKIMEIVSKAYFNRNVENTINILELKKNKKKQKDDLEELDYIKIQEIFK